MIACIFQRVQWRRALNGKPADGPGCACLVFACYLVVAAAFELCPDSTAVRTYSGLVRAGVESPPHRG
jgi:hypothetical protein